MIMINKIQHPLAIFWYSISIQRTKYEIDLNSLIKAMMHVTMKIVKVTIFNPAWRRWRKCNNVLMDETITLFKLRSVYQDRVCN